MDNFYVTLPSHVKSFSTNTVANFKTKLASSLSLTDDWEVGLVEISYTLSWYNLPNKEPFYLWYWSKGKSLKFEFFSSVPRGKYDSIQQIIDKINVYLIGQDFFEFKKVDNNEYKPYLELNETNRLITINEAILQKDNTLVFLEFSENLCNIFGLNTQQMVDKRTKKHLEYSEKYNENITNNISNDDLKFDGPEDEDITYKGENPVELSGGFHSLFVYSDIVSPSFVGDSYTQLLRLIEIPSNNKFGDQVKITYSNPYYLPVFVKEFDTIEIDIKDDTGERIPFEFGRSIITLHFRKVYKRSDNMFL